VSGDRIRLEVREREDLGSRRSRRLRKEGVIPGVLYGNGSIVPISVPERALRNAMTGPSGLHAILDVVVEGTTTVHPSILADYQQDPVRGTIAHIDLREVRLDQPINASVSVHLVGEAQGAQAGGVVSLVQRELNVEALPMEVPEHIEVDVTALDIGDVLRLEDIRAPEGVTFLDDLHETVIVSVALARAFVELEEAEAEAAAEAEAEAAEAAEGEEGEEGAPEARAEGEEAPEAETEEE
jgi:large subunit ribosomal protein L25